jgi:hypothetical protein
LTAVNLIAFFKALPKEEQYKFMELTKEMTKPIKINLPKNKKPVLTDEEALRYLTTVIFK